MEEANYIWKNGELVSWSECTAHVLSHSLHYGSALLEDLRCYASADGESCHVFRLRDHVKRLVRSAKICLTDLPFTADQLAEATLATVKANGLSSCVIRLLAYRGYGSMDINPAHAPVEVVIACWPQDVRRDEDALEQGIAAGISSWRQRSNNALPPQMQASASYMNFALAKLEAEAHGYDQAILLNEEGFVCEGAAETVFVVRDGVLSTPPTSDGALEGITRDTVLNLAMDLDIPVIEERLVRADLYAADEVFFAGSIGELTPASSVDGRSIGLRGPITRAIQERFFAMSAGELPGYRDWLSAVE